MSTRRPCFIAFFALVFPLLLAPPPGQAQSWRNWGTIPVFDGGRTMPMNSFAQQIVRDVCGTSRPFLVPDDSVIAELNKVIESQSKAAEEESETAFAPPRRRDGLIGGIDPGLGIATDETRRDRESETLAIRNMSRSQAERLVQRIQYLVPPQGRYFEANELLFSWMAEPKVWEYIPIFPVSESDYRSEVLNIPFRNNARTPLRRAAVFQLDRSETFQRRIADLGRKRRQSYDQQDIVRFDLITERLIHAKALFQELTFDPSRHLPDRMIGILHRTLDDSAGRQPSYELGRRAWRYLYELGAGPDDAPAAPSEFPEVDPKRSAHPTSERWQAIPRKIIQLAGAFEHYGPQGDLLRPNLRAVERQFELLLQLIDDNLRESETLMERAYPGVSLRNDSKDASKVDAFLPRLFSADNLERNKETIPLLILNYHYAVKKLRREVEAAYLSLYDNGRSLRVLPVVSTRAAGDETDLTLGAQPWSSLQSVLYGGDDFIRRFFDPDFRRDASTTEPERGAATAVGEHPGAEDKTAPEPAVVPGILSTNLDATGTANTGTEVSSTTEPADKTDADSGQDALEAEDQPVDERYEIDLFAPSESVYDLSSANLPPTSDAMAWVRIRFDRLYTAYTAPGRENSNEQFREAAGDLRQALSDAGDRIEARRNALAAPDDVWATEYLVKTAYPTPGAVHSEYRYYRLAPFFWMWIFAALAIVSVLVSVLAGAVRREMIDTSELHSASMPTPGTPRRAETPEGVWGAGGPGRYRPDFTNSTEEYALWGGIALLGLSILITFFGGAMRAWITGWAPVTNMYETVVLMAFSAAILGLWYALYPLLQPAWQLAWRNTSFPGRSLIRARFGSGDTGPDPMEGSGQYAMRQAALDFGVTTPVPGSTPPGPDRLVDSLAGSDLALRDGRASKALTWQLFFTIPRLLLMFLTFLFVVRISYGEYAHEHGVFAAAVRMLAMHDMIDWLVVVASIGVVVWFVPHLILTLLLLPGILYRPTLVAAELGIESHEEPSAYVPAPSAGRSEMSSVFHGEAAAASSGRIDHGGRVWLSLARNRILDRKLFVIVAAAVALLAGLAAQYNTTEFNPAIKPLVAVLRSNFWLSVHVIAIIVSYAAALIAWGMAVIALGGAIFGRYQRSETPDGRFVVGLPELCELFAPNILTLLRTSLLLLILGTILGARWADYSWGRFWSWDPKEVWALITILFFAIVLHGRAARYYGRLGVMIGALFGSIAVIVTWYGINFVFKGSIHSYGGGAASHATIFLWIFILLNLVWGFLAIFRYGAEAYGNETE